MYETPCGAPLGSTLETCVGFSLFRVRLNFAPVQVCWAWLFVGVVSTLVIVGATRCGCCRLGSGVIAGHRYCVRQLKKAAASQRDQGASATDDNFPGQNVLPAGGPPSGDLPATNVPGYHSPSRGSQSPVFVEIQPGVFARDGVPKRREVE